MTEPLFSLCLCLSGNSCLSDSSWIPLKNIQLNGIVLDLFNLQDINLDGASLKYAFMNLCIFYKAQLESVDFSYAHLYSSKFKDASLGNTNFDHAKLSNADFSENTTLARSSFYNANLQECDFSSAYLNGAYFGSEIIKAKDISPDSSYTYSFHTSTKFDNAGLRSANFAGAHLNESHFLNANLKGAIFSGANLEFAVFKDFNIGELIFTGEDFDRWINDKAKFIKCYVFDDFHVISQERLEAAGIEIREKPDSDEPE